MRVFETFLGKFKLYFFFVKSNEHRHCPSTVTYVPTCRRNRSRIPEAPEEPAKCDGEPASRGTAGRCKESQFHARD